MSANSDIAQRHSLGIDQDLSEIEIFAEEHYTSDNQEEPGVEYVMANKAIRNLRVLGEKNRDSGTPILIHLKTGGGDWNEGIAIYNAIKFCPVPTVILNHGEASSMSSIIFQAADRRIMMPDTTYMMHWGQDGHHGDSKEVASTFRFFHEDYKINEVMLEKYIKGIQRKDKEKTYRRIRNELVKQLNAKNAVWYTAEKAVESGLADGIFDGDWKKLTRNLKKIPESKK